MVFPYMDHDLCGLLANDKFRAKQSIFKLLMRQLLAGLNYIHDVRLDFGVSAHRRGLPCSADVRRETTFTEISKQPTS